MWRPISPHAMRSSVTHRKQIFLVFVVLAAPVSSSTVYKNWTVLSSYTCLTQKNGPAVYSEFKCREDIMQKVAEKEEPGLRVGWLRWMIAACAHRFFLTCVCFLFFFFEYCNTWQNRGVLVTFFGLVHVSLAPRRVQRLFDLYQSTEATYWGMAPRRCKIMYFLIVGLMACPWYWW